MRQGRNSDWSCIDNLSNFPACLFLIRPTDQLSLRHSNCKSFRWVSAYAGASYLYYTSVNLTNADTIEFRIFRGTLKYNTLIATLQLLDRICDVALFLSDDEIKAMSWTTFVSGCTAPELVQYLKERRLYVNEPVESEGEV